MGVWLNPKNMAVGLPIPDGPTSCADESIPSNRHPPDVDACATTGVRRRELALGTLVSSWIGSSSTRTAQYNFAAGGDYRGDAAELQRAINEAARLRRPLILQSRVYLLRPNDIKLRSDLVIVGVPGATLQVTHESGQDGAILSGTRLKNVRIQGVNFAAPSDRTWALSFISCSNIQIIQNVAKACSLVRFSAGLDDAYKTMRKEDCCSNVSVIGNVLDGPTRPEAHGGICLYYTLGAEILNNRITRHGHGIWWYGGDSAKIPGEGSRASPRWVQDVRIEGNDISDIASSAGESGGGIWGGKGERIKVLRNNVRNCTDLEIDFEGCVDCEATDNDVFSSISNACLAIFFFCDNIRFARNRVVRGDGGRVFNIFNATQQFAETGPCVIEDNDFQCRRVIGVLGAGSAIASFRFLNNRLQNVRVERSPYTIPEQEYRGNTLHFAIKSADPFDALFSKAGGSMAGRRTTNFLSDNIITSSMMQPVGCRAIVIEDSDYAVDCNAVIRGNKTLGFPIDIAYVASAENRIAKTARIENNVIQNCITREEANKSIGRTTVILTDNRQMVGDRLINYPNHIPTSGLWNAGQRIFFDRPDMDGAVGANCIRTGVPGEWRKFK